MASLAGALGQQITTILLFACIIWIEMKRYMVYGFIIITLGIASAAFFLIQWQAWQGLKHGTPVPVHVNNIIAHEVFITYQYRSTITARVYSVFDLPRLVHVQKGDVLTGFIAPDDAQTMLLEFEIDQMHPTRWWLFFAGVFFSGGISYIIYQSLQMNKKAARTTANILIFYIKKLRGLNLSLSIYLFLISLILFGVAFLRWDPTLPDTNATRFIAGCVILIFAVLSTTLFIQAINQFSIQKSRLYQVIMHDVEKIETMQIQQKVSKKQQPATPTFLSIILYSGHILRLDLNAEDAEIITQDILARSPATTLIK